MVTGGMASKWDQKGMDIAYEEAALGYKEGGVPIGGCLINNKDGSVLGRGHNMRFQKGSATLHGEISTLENCGRLEGKVYKDTTLYTTLSHATCVQVPSSCMVFHAVLSVRTLISKVRARNIYKLEVTRLLLLTMRGVKRS